METATWHEWLRLALATLGICVAWRGRALVLRQEFKAPLGATARQVAALMDDWADRLSLYQSLQWSIIAVHALLLVNVATNLFYSSAPLEQPNVATSNVMQMTIPAILIRASELISARIRAGDRVATAAATTYAGEGDA